MAGTFTITGLSASEPTGSRTFGPITIQGTVVIGETIVEPLASGDNTVAVPLQSVACLIVSPTNGTTTLKVRTNIDSTDVGLEINGNGLPTLISWPSPIPTSLIINSSAASSAPISVVFI